MCNTTKRDKFAIRDLQGAIVHLSRKPKEVPVMPPEGPPLLLDPRQDDPFAFLMLDIVDTFAFVPVPGKDGLINERATYTIATLGLNRDLLVRARREAYASYVARLTEYVLAKEAGADMAHRVKLATALFSMQHPGGWFEMQRWRDAVENLQTLFRRAPEMLPSNVV